MFIIHFCKAARSMRRLSGPALPCDPSVLGPSQPRIRSFKVAQSVIIKHNNACGVASSKTIRGSFIKALKSDKKSAFGGVIVVNKKIDDVKIVVSGAGAAAIACTKLYISFGAKLENIVMTDSKGVINQSRSGLSDEKKLFITKRKINSLEEAMENSDVFIGLSMANILSVKMLASMSKDPIVFAMANPDPEIDYNTAMSVRDDIIFATGRSDLPNQVNNVLGFPFIFRGALDVRATKINEEMKMAAVKALADLAKEPVPEQVNIAYGETRLAFGKDYIIPKPFDPRLISEVPPAVAKAAMESGVAQEPITDWDKYTQVLEERLGNNQKLIRITL